VVAVDGSVFVLKLLREVIGGETDIDLVGVAANGLLGLDKVQQLKPDLVLLDVDMPVMDGLEMLTQLRQLDENLRVVMYSSLTEPCAQTTLKALSLGADDYVPKGENDFATAGGFQTALKRAREELLPKIRQYFLLENASAELKEIRKDRTGLPPLSTETPTLLAIASSTGGPSALNEILPKFPMTFPVPAILVQHMPPTFTALLAKQLNAACALNVKEAAEGEILTAGNVYVAPGGYHLRVLPAGRTWRASLDQTPPVNGCRPAADFLFSSLARLPEAHVLGVVLTGMGRDGTKGALELRSVGAPVLVQDEATSAVWGMPGSIVEAGLAADVLPLQGMADAILTRCMPKRAAGGARGTGSTVT
jgi:two-component system chemotaxis response regulator CheB